MLGMLRRLIVVGVVSLCLISAQSVVVRSQGGPGLPWMNTSLAPEQRADLLIAQMTLPQKVQQLSNDVRPLEDPDNRPPGCEYERIARYIHGVPELGIPNFRMTNGGTGLRGGSCLPQPEATAVPSASAIGAGFNRQMARELGHVLGNEAKLWGHQVLLGPLMNMVRHPYGGRNFDFPGEDPYLTGVMSVETVKGIQAQGVHSVPKHIVGNEQETDRNGGDSVIPPRALHEIYLLPFEMSARDGRMAGVMCAYNRLNGTSSCSDAELLTTTLRDRWGFEGYVVTDRRALHDLAPSIKAGVDWELAHETPHYYTLEPKPATSRQGASEGISAALEAGSITVADIDQMLRRRYVQMFEFGHFDTNFDITFEATPDFNAHGLVAREIAEQAIVLLKNQNAFLPLRTDNVESIALIGATWYAGMAKMAPLSLRGENANVDAPYTVTPKEGLENVLRSLGSAATVTYDSGGGTGTQADIDRAVELARESDIVIVMVGDNPYEVCDVTPRLPIVPPADENFCAYQQLTPGTYELGPTPRGKGTDQEALLQALTADPAIAQKMVVVLKTQGMVLMPWLDKVPALVEAWYPGQEDGSAVANVLFGLRNPSGKLPMTFGTSAREAAYSTPEQFPGVWEPAPPWEEGQVLSPRYSEDLQVGYRWYEANGVAPLFPFGFGLSYTTFAYSGLSVTPSAAPLTGEPVLTVTYTIANTGARPGAEASQVYLTLPPEAKQPSKRLVGFEKVDLQPGESRQVMVTIDASASNHPLSYWVPVTDAPAPGWSQGEWRTASGSYTVHVGTSSADTPLTQAVAITAPGPGPGPGPTPDQPAISVADVTVVEGSGGTTTAHVTLTLSAASTQPVTVAYQLVGGTATEGTDYTAASGTVRFAPGETTMVIPVTVTGDAADEDDEQFTVQLSAPTNATLADPEAVATIADDDGLFRRYLAEGATSTFFDTRIALFNPSATAPATVTLRFLRADGTTVTHALAVPALGRRTVDPKTVAGLETAEFATVIESDRPVVADRTMTWDAQGYGSHAETSVAAPARTWYLAEGATHSGFELFYLVQNANDAVANVTVTYLLPAPAAAVVRTYAIDAHARFTLWVDQEPGLDNIDVSAMVTADQPVIVERAMYRDAGGLQFGAGHESAGVTAPATTWYLAEGATGPFFDLFIPIANPGTTAASVTATFLRPNGTSVEKGYTVAPQSRFNIWVDLADPQLADTAVSTIVRSTNGVPIVVERVMWWPGDSTTWTEAHTSPGATQAGVRWGLAEGELGGTRGVETYLLIANPSATAGSATVTLYFEDGGAPASRTYALAARSRLDVPVAGDFPAAAGRRFGAIVESTGSPAAQIVVERAMYSSAAGVVWAAGTSALAAPLASTSP